MILPALAKMQLNYAAPSTSKPLACLKGPEPQSKPSTPYRGDLGKGIERGLGDPGDSPVNPLSITGLRLCAVAETLWFQEQGQ
jgi:hypothetical protein